MLESYVKDNVHVLVKCKNMHDFYITPGDLRNGNWCGVCRESKGELKVSQTLTSFNISYVKQFQHPLIPNFKYDFYFMYNGIAYLVEFDGIQHFQYGYFHKSEEDFEYRQEIDHMKTYIATVTGYHLIRIDYTKIENISECLIGAINSNSILYVSTPELYKWLSLPFNIKLIQQHCPQLITVKIS